MKTGIVTRYHISPVLNNHNRILVHLELTGEYDEIDRAKLQ